MNARSRPAFTTFTIALSAAVAAAVEPPPQLARIDAAARRAANYLIAQQSPDGAWRSEVYPPFRAGDTLTPLVLAALVERPGALTREPPIAAGIDYLAGMLAADGRIAPPPDGFAYSVYTSAGAVIVLSRAGPRYERARDAWLGFLLERQLIESLGWSESDSFYGGWGYAKDPPRKPGPSEPLAPLSVPNLSATVFALSALRAAAVDPVAPEVQKALRFVRSCQNYSDDSAQRVSAGGDGGFFFMPGDPVRNKAGIVRTAGVSRFASYGSATVDGLRALAFGAQAEDAPRTAAAWQWLAENFQVERHPGRYEPAREAARDAVYYYYCHSLAALLADAEAWPASMPIDSTRWAATIAAELVTRQRPDGSWVNAAVDVREDDPLVATSFALRALALARRAIVVESATTPRAPHDQRPGHSNSTVDRGG
jgi:hypothetical protein